MNTPSTTPATTARHTVRVWDPLIRIFHWGLAGAFALAWLTGEAEIPLHDVFGYAILALLAVRLVWGVVGSRHARFTDFLRGPRAVFAYLRDIAAFRARRYLGHNLAGGAMVIALMLSLVLASVSGIALEGAAEGVGWLGHLQAQFGRAGADALENLHEGIAGFTLFLVGLHIAGVLFASVQHRENLVRAMIDGRKRADD